MNEQMKKICAVTMVRNDEFFLRKWIEYYGTQFGTENLYVYLDGADQTLPDDTRGANIIAVDRIAGNVARADRGRINFLSARAAELLGRYDLVVGTDVDEFLVVDPALGESLTSYLSRIEISPSVSGLGIDIGQHLGCETEIDASRPFLEQRRFGFLSSRYTKSSVISRAVSWGSGFHRVRNHNFRIDPNLYLFHFGCIDLKRLEARFGDRDRIDNGWSRHLTKRARTIKIVTETPAEEWAPAVAAARRMQTWCRLISAWNKPVMIGRHVVVVPERFRTVL